MMTSTAMNALLERLGEIPGVLGAFIARDQAVLQSSLPLIFSSDDLGPAALPIQLLMHEAFGMTGRCRTILVRYGDARVVLVAQPERQLLGVICQTHISPETLQQVIRASAPGAELTAGVEQPVEAPAASAYSSSTSDASLLTHRAAHPPTQPSGLRVPQGSPFISSLPFGPSTPNFEEQQETLDPEANGFFAVAAESAALKLGGAVSIRSSSPDVRSAGLHLPRSGQEGRADGSSSVQSLNLSPRRTQDPARASGTSPDPERHFERSSNPESASRVHSPDGATASGAHQTHDAGINAGESAGGSGGSHIGNKSPTTVSSGGVPRPDGGHQSGSYPAAARTSQVGGANGGAVTARATGAGNRGIVPPLSSDARQRLQHELARFVGPVAGLLLDEHLAQGAGLPHLIERLAKEIDAPDDQRQFLARVEGLIA